MTEERNRIPGIIIERAPEAAPGPGMVPADAEATTPIQAAQILPGDKPAGPKAAERRGFKYLLWDVLSVVVSAIIIAAALKLFVVDSRIVPTGSMIPTINAGDRVIILKLPYILGKTPNCQDVVVFAAPEEFGTQEDLLKRVIGTPGDTVEVREGLVYVNGVALDEPYLAEQSIKNFEKVTVPEGCYFMMGDNRNHSRDSTMWNDPFVPFSDIKGRVLVCYWPMGHWGIIE